MIVSFRVVLGGDNYNNIFNTLLTTILTYIYVRTPPSTIRLLCAYLMVFKCNNDYDEGGVYLGI